MNLQVDLNLNLRFDRNTDGRTDGLTKNLVTADYQETAVDAHARTAKVGSR